MIRFVHAGRVLSIFVLLVLGAADSSQAGDPPAGAKELFFERGAGDGGRLVHLDAPAVSDAGALASDSDLPAGLRYWIELQDPSKGGETQHVTESRVFRDGERIRIRVDGSRDGYVSVLQAGASGQLSPLYPADSNVARIQAGETATIPADVDSWFRFDQRKGLERIFLLFAPTQAQLEAALAATRTLSAEVGSGTEVVRRAGAKDLVIEIDPADSTYLMSPSGEAVVYEIRLSHQ